MQADAASTVARVTVTAYEQDTGLVCTEGRRRLVDRPAHCNVQTCLGVLHGIPRNANDAENSNCNLQGINGGPFGDCGCDAYIYWSMYTPSGGSKCDTLRSLLNAACDWLCSGEYCGTLAMCLGGGWPSPPSSSPRPPPPPPWPLPPPPQPPPPPSPPPGTSFVFEVTIPKTSLTAEQEKGAAQSYLQTIASKANSNSGLLEIFPSLQALSVSVSAMTITSATVVQTTSTQESLVFTAPSPPPPQPPPQSKSEVQAAGPGAIDAGGDEESGAGLIVGAIVGCLALVAALGAGGFYCYKKKTQPPRPANVEIVVSSPSSDEGAARGTAAPTEQEEAPAMVNQAVLPPAVPLQVVGAPSKGMTLTAVLASCGLEHRAKLFEDEGYTLEVAFRALDSGQSTLMTDLRDLTLTLGECRKLTTKLKAAKDSKI
eukprot:scaffold5926_cov65-Phaeocystis_antarctica.AAC.2